jgi:nucleotide-binding universal stress UspA family protein
MMKKKKYLIVIGTRARWKFKNLLFGSAASGVIRYANCPVLVTNR